MSADLSILEREIGRVVGGFPQVAAAWLFGSVARGDARPDSDLDIAVLFRRAGDTALDHHRDLRIMAAELERVAGGRRVDVVVIETQGVVFRHRVLAEGRRLVDADPERRIDFESDTTVRYLDFLPTHDLASRNARAGYRDWLESRR